MWKALREFVRPQAVPDDSLIEFEDGLLLIVDAEQLTNNLRSKLRRSVGAEDAIVYLADVSEAARGFTPVQSVETQDVASLWASTPLPDISANSKMADWFRSNREILLLDSNNAVIQYLHDELDLFLNHGMELVLPLISMERLIGLVFLRLGQTALSKDQLMNLQLLSKQAGLAFENALLFKERLRQNERMYRAEQLATMGQFAAGIAHELRNPLTAIRSTIQFLASEFAEGSEQQRLSQITLEEVDRVNGIVGNLLSLAQPAESKPAALDLAREVEKCIAFVEARARSQNVELRVVCEEQLPKLVIDPAELRQVLLNIIVNGLQAMPRGGTLEIRVHRPPSPVRGPESGGTFRVPGDGILIEVTDHGPGISPELRDRVFEPFFTTKAGGTGLGLAICRSIVRRYDGEIWIEEAQGGGTSVKVALQAE
jgi:signal transduction histidine kinase